MKPKTLFFILSCVHACNTSCNKIILKLAGFQKPKLENEASLKAYAFELGLDTSDI